MLKIMPCSVHYANGNDFAGVEPRYMGIGPVAAIPKVLAKNGLQKEDVDVWEVRSQHLSRSLTNA